MAFRLNSWHVIAEICHQKFISYFIRKGKEANKKKVEEKYLSNELDVNQQV